MRKEKSKFSAFKLFYNEIIYKDNSSVNYYNVEYNIKEIRNIVLTVRSTPKNNVDFYNTKLNRAKKRIKYHLGKIAEYNNDIYEYFYFLYKTKTKDLPEDKELIPYLLTDSFYEDYKIDKEGNYKDNNVVPRFSSLEKKHLRDDARNISGFEYFIKLLAGSDYSFLYYNFLNKASYLLNVKPLYDEEYSDYHLRTNKILNETEHLIRRIEKKAKYCDDYEIFKESMNIIYKINFDDWTNKIRELIIDYFNKIYNDNKDNMALKEMFNKSNDITYQRYCELSDILVEEKANLMESFDNGSFVKKNINDSSYTIRFKDNLINNYFDQRYKNSLKKNSKVTDYVDRAIELYDLAAALADEVFERIVFDSSYSESLMRNNDVNSALLIKIYDLYNPIYLIGIYQKAKNEFDECLKEHDQEFTNNYEKYLNNRKMEYDYHGPVPSMETIKTNIVNRRKEFILEHCITDLKNIDIFRNYDTRNYDLTIMADGLKNGELVNLYEDIKEKINSFDYTSMHFYDKLVNKEKDLEKNLLLKAAQEFIVKLIYNNLDLKLNSDMEINDKYRDICYGYLNEQILFLDDNINDKNNDNKFDEFLVARNSFKEVSKWAEYIKN